jgi:hypothetical protein
MTVQSDLVRPTRDFLLNVLAAVLGPVLVESEVAHVFHPKTTAGAYTAELVVSALTAFLFCCLVYFKWRLKAAQWVWALGLVGFAWRLLLGIHGPTSPNGDLYRALLGSVSVRLVAYSAGAMCCAGLSAFTRDR